MDTAPVIALRGVSVAYDRHVALADVDLEVRAGERVALVGPSGAGKSTLLRLCTGAVRPVAGEVDMLGQSLVRGSAPDHDAVRRRTGTIHQRLHLVRVRCAPRGRRSADRRLHAGRPAEPGDLLDHPLSTCRTVVSPRRQ